MTSENSTPPTTTPPCYGVYWEANSEPDCKGCLCKEGCFQRFAVEYLPRIRAKLGDGATLEKLAEETSVGPEAILIALNHVSQQGVSDLPEAPDDGGTLMEIFKADSPDVPLAGLDLGADPEPAAPAVDAAEEVAPKKAIKKKATKKVAKKATKKVAKKATKKKGAKKVDNPRKTGSAQRASDPVSRKAARDAVKAAAARVSETRVWGDADVRWQRERDRVPAIGAIPIGGILEKEYTSKLLKKTATYRVKCLQGRWQNLATKEEYPTLHVATQAIAGVWERPTRDGTRVRVQSNWSAKAFWKTALAEAATGRTRRG